MIIKNFPRLVSSPLRKAALDILEAGLAALDTKAILSSTISLADSVLRVKDRQFDLSRFSPIFVVGFGKAAVPMGQVIEDVLGPKITAGFILDRRPAHFRYLKSLVATHPSPSLQNVAATQGIIDLIKKADRNALIILLISGGGSAMLTSPYKISAQRKWALTKKLMDSGAGIAELNVVRKHLSKIKGGQLIQYTYPATVLALIFSDVAGDDLATIASGPTVRDPSTVKESREILQKYGLKDTVELRETPKDPVLFEHVTNIIIGNAELALKPMEDKARKLGFSPRVWSTNLSGEANQVGRKMIKSIGRGEALLAIGETTVKVRGKGAGGRNQQLVISALPYLTKGQLLAAVNTDGHDNSDFAGAIGDWETVRKTTKLGLDSAAYARENDSFTFFKAVGDGIETGELESNFADIVICLWEKV